MVNHTFIFICSGWFLMVVGLITIDGSGVRTAPANTLQFNVWQWLAGLGLFIEGFYLITIA